MYGFLLYAGVVLAGILGLAVTAMALPQTLRDLWGSITGNGNE